MEDARSRQAADRITNVCSWNIGMLATGTMMTILRVAVIDNFISESLIKGMAAGVIKG